MKIDHAQSQDLPSIMNIIKDAQRYLAALNIDQWQDGYPDQVQLENDIINQESYVITNDKNKIMATVMFTTRKESTYQNIDGAWVISESLPYGVIHRLAVADEFRSMGLAKFAFDYFEKQLITLGITNLKIDTHPDNLGMQKLIKNRAYQYCGVITLESKAIRFAFEKGLT